MVIMALDHVRDYFHIQAFTGDPLDVNTTTTALYFTRWVTHFCAPVFVFLSGVSIYLQSLRKTKMELSAFIIKRGLWLIFAEIVIIALAWTFNPFYNLIPLGVIWAIGISMVILGLFMRMNLRENALIAISIFILFGHNLLDFIETAPGFTPNFWWDLLHTGYFKPYEFAPNRFVLLIYPFVAWTGLMIAGFCAGKIFSSNYSQEQRSKILTYSGSAMIVFFFLLRFSNLYGDPTDWTKQSDAWKTFLSFMNVDKYPPSLLYLSITIGPALLLLVWLEKISNTFTQVLSIFGRTAFFYYLLHLFLIHMLATVVFFAKGHTFSEAMEVAKKFPFLFLIPGEGFSLAGVFGIWILVIILLYPVCKWYDRYKKDHREKWWLSYL